MTRIGDKEFNDLPVEKRMHLAPKILGENSRYPFLEDAVKQERDEIETLIEGGGKSHEGLLTPEGKYMEKILRAVFSAELAEDAKNDPEERRRIGLCKERIRQYVGNVLESIRVYMGTILDLENATRSGFDFRVAEADTRRTQAHNALIGDINILNRSLIWWFGNFDPSNLPEAQMEMYEKQDEDLISQHVERIDIPDTGICPTTFSINNRKEITRWAKGIYKDLIQIQKLSGLVD